MSKDRRRKELLSQLRATPLVFLGLGVYRAWMTLVFRKLDLAGSIEVLFGLNLYDTSLACTALACALLARRIAPLSSKRGFSLAAAVLMTIGTALGIAGLFLSGFAAEHVVMMASVVSGIGTAFVILLWAEFYASLNPLRVVLYHSASLLFGEFLSFLLDGFNLQYSLGFALILPVASLAMQRKSMREIPDEDKPKKTWGSYSFPWKPVVLMAICAFAYRYGSSAPSGVAKEPMSYLGVVLPAVVILAGTLSQSKHFNFGFIYRIGLPAMIIGFLLVTPSLNISEGLSRMFLTGGYIAFSVLIMLILSNISYRFGISAVWLCGIERGIRYLFMAIGRALRDVVASNVAMPDVSLLINTIITIVLVVVFAAVFFSEKELSAKWGLSLSPHAGTEALETDRLAMRVADLSKTYALSPREEEVLQLLAQRKSTVRIEHELYIANGTVKAHIRHIYGKLGIHSKSELYEVLGIGGC